MTFSVQVITLVPDIWPVVLGDKSGLVGRAFSDGRLSLTVHDLRGYGHGVHKKVDDSPFGGGAGMVLMVDPLRRAIDDAKKISPGPVIMTTPRGEPFTQSIAAELAAGPGFTMVCGRYEGVDERILSHVDRQVSLGDFVLSAGDPAAWAVIDGVARLHPGVLGNAASLDHESFNTQSLEYPQYTRPADYEGQCVPDVLRSGNHAAIETWRREQSERITREHRPDLLK